MRAGDAEAKSLPPRPSVHALAVLMMHAPARLLSVTNTSPPQAAAPGPAHRASCAQGPRSLPAVERQSRPAHSSPRHALSRSQSTMNELRSSGKTGSGELVRRSDHRDLQQRHQCLRTDRRLHGPGKQRAFHCVRALKIPTPRWTVVDTVNYDVKMGLEVPWSDRNAQSRHRCGTPRTDSASRRSPCTY